MLQFPGPRISVRASLSRSRTSPSRAVPESHALRKLSNFLPFQSVYSPRAEAVQAEFELSFLPNVSRRLQRANNSSFGSMAQRPQLHHPLQGRRLSVSEHAIVHATEHDQLVVKSFYSLTGAEVTPKAIREMRMMLLAGADVSVTLKGRLIRGGTIEGFVVPYEQPLEAELASASTGTKMQRNEQLQVLVRRMHAKGVLHGDIKPDNVLVRKSDGQLVLCDWAAAQVQSETEAPREGTTAYQSPWRCRNTELPLCRQDDLYALGVSIWQIWQGRAPFDPERHEYLDEDIADGLQPNLDEVDDATVRGLQPFANVRAILLARAGFAQSGALEPRRYFPIHFLTKHLPSLS